MSEIDVQTTELTLTTVKLSTKILKQMPRLRYESVKHLLKDAEGVKEEFKGGALIGWINGAGLGESSSETYLLLRISEGQYGLFNAMGSWRVKCKQIYVV